MRRLSRTSITVAVLAATLSCTGDERPTDPGSADAPQLAQDTATPGAAIELRGLDPAIDLDEIVVEVGGEAALIASNAEGEIRVVVPWEIDPTTLEIIVPAARTDLVIRRGDVIVHELSSVLAITAPDPEPGVCARVLADIEIVDDAIAEVLSRIPAPTVEDREALDTLAPILAWFTDPDNPESITSRVNAATDAELALLDRIWTYTGLADQMSDLAAVSREVVQELERREGREGDDPITLEDYELAALMQFAVVYQAYGEYFIHGTAEWISVGNTASGVGLGIVALFKKVPQIGIPLTAVNLGMSLKDFILNKHLLALLPSRIDEVSLGLQSSTLHAGHFTSSQRSIRASNDPPDVTLNDFIAQVLNAAGLVAPADLTAMEELVLTFISTIVEQINSALASFAEAHPEVIAPSDVYQVPDYSWTATLDTASLIDLEELSDEDAILEARPDLLEWEAAAGANGQVTVWIQPSRDDEAIALDLGFIDYNGGAFGEDIVASERRTITIRTPLDVEVSSASTIAEGGINAVSVFVFRETAPGVREPAVGVPVQLQVTGGILDALGGVIDATGELVTTVRPAEGSAEVVITARAQDAFNQDEDEIHIAVTPVGGEVYVTDIDFHGIPGVEASAFAGEGTEFCWDPDPQVAPDVDPELGVHLQWACELSDSEVTEGAWAKAAAALALDLDVERDDDQRVTRIDWRTASTVSGAHSPCDPGPGGASSARTSHRVNVRLNVASVTAVRVSGELDGTAGVLILDGSGGQLVSWTHTADPGDPPRVVDEVITLTPGQWTCQLYERQAEGGACVGSFEGSFATTFQLTFE